MLREKDTYQSDGEAYVVERPVYTPIYRRVDEQGNIIDEPAATQQVVQLVELAPEQQIQQPVVYANTEVQPQQDSVYANIGQLEVQHADGTHSQPPTVGQKGGLGIGIDVNLSGPNGQQRTVASATVGAKAGGKEEKKGGLSAIFG